MVRKVIELTDEIDNSYNKINIIVGPGDIESFIKLKKAVDSCVEKRNRIDLAEKPNGESFSAMSV